MVNNAENALKEVKRKLYNHWRILIVKEWWIDHGRKAIIQTEKGDRFFVLFKREFFHTYGRMKGTTDEDGESLNVEDFEFAVYDRDIEQFLYIYPCNTIYKARARDIKKNSMTHNNESDGRPQYLFPLTVLQKIA